MQRYYVIYEGIVQGVGFRWSTIQIAESLNLTGFVRNCNNGNVEVEVQGNKEAIDEFLKQMLTKRRFIQIYDYQLKKIPLIEEESSFEVKF